MADVIKAFRCTASLLYFLVASVLMLTLLGYAMALGSGQAGVDLRAVPVMVSAAFAAWFAYRVWPKR